jgi:hypothetical protein
VNAVGKAAIAVLISKKDEITLQSFDCSGILSHQMQR